MGLAKVVREPQPSHNLYRLATFLNYCNNWLYLLDLSSVALLADESVE